jgi:hypothetical protein
MTEPKNEPVRIALPARPDKASPPGNGAEHPAVRIVLPTRTPVAPVRREPPKITPLQPAAPEPQAAVPTESGPKNETARISTLTPPLVVTASRLDPFDAIPPTFRWALFGTASANFLIQIWIYVVS